MSNLIHFDFKGNTLNAMLVNNEPYFIAKDVASILGYVKTENAIARHCKAPITTPKQGGGYMTIIPERDVYRLVMRSKLPEAEQFEEWVVSDVLPSIRKTGGYSIVNTLPDFNNPVEAARAWANEKERTIQYQALIEQQKPAVDFVDNYVKAEGNYNFRQVAKLLNAKEPELKLFLIEGGVIYITNGTMTPKQQHVNAGRFIVKTDVTKTGHSYTQMKITPKGFNWISELWANRLGEVA